MAKRAYPQSGAAPAQGGMPRTLTEAAYERLRNDIIEGVLAPGEKLLIENLKARYAVSAATLREAITRLQSDALVISEGQRGFWVAPVSLEDLEDLTQLRCQIEIEALRRSIRHNTPLWREELQKSFQALEEVNERRLVTSNRTEWEHLNTRFHRALISGAMSPWTERILQLLSRQSERYRRLSIAIHESGRDVHAEHQMIYEAAISGEEARASLALEMHIRNTPDLILRAQHVLPENSQRKGSLNPLRVS